PCRWGDRWIHDLATGWLGSQNAGIPAERPAKVEKLRNSSGGMINRMTRIIRNVTDELTPPAPAPAKSRPDEEKPVPVEIRKTTFSPLEFVPNVLGSVLNILM